MVLLIIACHAILLQMVLVNVMVVVDPKSTVLVTWEIMGVHNPNESFQSLFDRKIVPNVRTKISEVDAQNMSYKMICWAY